MAKKKLAKVDLAELKAGGLLKQKQPDLFSVRLHIPVGRITSEQVKKVAEIAERYGQSFLHLTMRQGIEIPFVNFDDINTVIEELKSVNMGLGACGARVRVVTGCPGAAWCPWGLQDAQAYGKRLDEIFYGRSGLPHKFKMGVAGCPNSCAKPNENDVGFLGVAEPVFEETDEKKCISCGLCVDACPVGGLKLVDGKPVIDREKCVHDVKCVLICPKDVLKIRRQGWNVYVGGKWGKFPQLGVLFAEFVSDDEGIELVEKILKAYSRLSPRGERLGELINRIGLETFRREAQKEAVKKEEALSEH
jgi:dissimilatory sulfite reductase (desulfoviridin) alpha/beta subunit